MTDRTGLREAGLTDVSLTSTRLVGDGMHSVIVRATKPVNLDAPMPMTTSELPIALTASGCRCGSGSSF